VTNCRTCN